MGLRSIHLFAGTGGGCLADVLLGHEIACYVEREPYCQRVLEQRIRDGVLPDAPIWDDVRTFPAHLFRGVDLVCGGFPCPSFSVAGKGLAGLDERNCWPATFDIIRCIRPRFAFLENVPALTSGSHGYFGTILGDLASIGFDVEWGVLSASDVGAPHIRKRLWILATDADADRVRVEPERHEGRRFDVQGRGKAKPLDAGEDVANADGGRLEGEREQRLFNGERQTQRNDAYRCGGQKLANANDAGRQQQRGPVAVATQHTAPECRSFTSRWWDADPADRPTESGVGRVVNGLAHRVDRLRATGNGQVPLVAASAFQQLMSRLVKPALPAADDSKANVPKEGSQ